jgi:hypothetical protein
VAGVLPIVRQELLLPGFCKIASGADVLRRLIAVVAVCVLGISSAAFAQQTPPKKRVALVIGIDKYASLVQLDNPVLDAKAMAELLGAHGYDVSAHYDLNRDDFERALSRFSKKAEGAETALVFYAGHGMEIIDKNNTFNVLAPTDVEIDCDAREAFRFVKLEELFHTIEGVPNQVVIVDACREIAFRSCPVKRGARPTRGFGFRGYLPEAKGEAILVAYSTGQKALASDGEKGQHSPFAKELLSQLKDNPQTNFLPLMNRMVINVGKATDFKQVPSIAIEGGIVETCLAGKDCREAVDDVEGQRQLVRALASNSEQQLQQGFPVEAMLLALEALPDMKAEVRRPYDAVAERNLKAAYSARLERAVLGS